MRVLIIDDHTLFRDGLQGLLERHNIEVVASLGDGQEGIRLAQTLLPDIVLLDMRMPTITGLEVLKNLQANKFEAPVVMLTTSNDERDLVEALRNGAKGYLLKEMEPDDVVAALREIVKGETVVAPNLTQILARVVKGEPILETEPSPIDDLTPREAEILSLLAEGQSNKVIARNLGISDGTVKLHVKAILRKLNIHSRVEAAVIAVEHGLRASKQN
ncbi:response regulator [Gammaproteobacteria bacterium]|nr:response regulator [Pseudomonadota bacterium]MDB0063590.1 response regulator [Gammaproteobacteria bacterium]MDC1284745.1 response regulator [Gammaproteobacteria bacterium]MDG1249423.1 response regulator [Gammaproteobacteria bacterium]